MRRFLLRIFAVCKKSQNNAKRSKNCRGGPISQFIMSRTTHSLVTFSLKNVFQRGILAGLFFSEDPRRALQPLLAHLKALQRLCWMGYAKKNFFRNFLNHVIHKNIALKKMQVFLHFHTKDSHFSDKKLFATKNHLAQKCTICVPNVAARDYVF